jgi:hypothetical protein
MTERILDEIRFIESDEGFRVEVKGDKEQLKKMFHMHKGFKPGSCFGRGRGRFWARGHGCGPPPWAWEWEESTEEQTTPPDENEA